MPKCVSASCDRGNIYLSVSKRPSSSGGSHTAEDSFISVLKPLLDEIRNKGKLFPKTIVYMKLKWCGFAYDYFNHELECVGEKSNANISLVAQYHASCKDEVNILFHRIKFMVFVIIDIIDIDIIFHIKYFVFIIVLFFA